MAASDSKQGRRWRWIAGGIAALVVLIVAVPFLYIHLIAGPPPKQLRLPSSPTTSSGSPSSTAGASTLSVDGAWRVATGSQAGYRVKEVLAGQPDTAVGRTGQVTGSFEVTGSTVTTGTVTVDLRTVTSDEGRRDDQFNGRIMDTAAYPFATFTLTKPIELGSAAARDKVAAVQATGTLAMHGVTRSTTASLQVRYTGSTFQVSGSIPVKFSDWAIANPSFAGFVTTEDHGTVEFLILATRG